MKVFITSKTAFDDMMKRKGITNENVETYKKTFFISINDTCGTDETPYFENKDNVIVLFFDDVETDIQTKHGIAKAFTNIQAKQLLQFIDRNKDKESCIVHCAAGISRSGAVGTFVNDYFKGDWFEFKKTNPYIHPNGLVFRLLKKAAMETRHSMRKAKGKNLLWYANMRMLRIPMRKAISKGTLGSYLNRGTINRIFKKLIH